MCKPICPVCGAPLAMRERAWGCAEGHSFDLAKQGYVNLLPVQQKRSLHPGDTLEQVHARRRFLGAGHYAPIAQAVCELLGGAGSVLDVGCGEGYYLRAIGRNLPECARWGVDISRDAVRLAAGADKKAQYLVATAAHLPFADASFEAIVSLFALTVPEEFARVLAPQGRYLLAQTEEDHLQALKSLIYPELIRHEKALSPALPGFRPVAQKELCFDFMLTDNAAIQDLLAMTPHFWRITRAGAERAAHASALHDTAHIRLSLYEKI